MTLAVMNTTLERTEIDRLSSVFDDTSELVGRPPARRTKIVCTLGPATTEPAAIRDLIASGMDVARFNFSHGNHGLHRQTASAVRHAASQLGRPVVLMQDLQGPKLRIGSLPGGSLELAVGQRVELAPGRLTIESSTIPVPHAELLAALRPLDRVLFGDGEVAVSVSSRWRSRVECTVVEGGCLAEHKGICAPGRPFHAPILGPGDLADMAFGESIGFDLLAVSFVRAASEVHEVRRLTRRLGWKVAIVAKIETQEALSDLDAIVAASDAVMVARGDLGLQLPLAELPAAQKTIIRTANRAAVPVITATQMLESMVTSVRPTRAEACDVANAVWDGTDAVMLSAETSVGQHPALAVRVMADLCLGAEACGAWQRSHGVGWPVRSTRSALSLGEG